MAEKVPTNYGLLMRLVLLLFSVFFIWTGVTGGSLSNNYGGKYDPFESAIPPEFGKDSTPLVFTYNHERYKTKILDKIIPEAYTGEYMVVKSSTINLNEVDSVNYRYIFDHLSTTSGNPMVQGSAGSYSSSFYFLVYDRKIQKEYRYKCNGSKKDLKKYLFALDRERLENAGTI